MKRFAIGGFQLVLNSGALSLLEDSFISKFRCEDQELPAPDPIVYDLICSSLSSYGDTPILHYCGSSELHDTEKGKLLIGHWATCRFAYGFFLEELMGNGAVRCYYDPKLREEIPLSMSRFFSLAGLSSKLLQRNAVVLHCSYVERDGEAVLFVGQSGAGKSTQAALWEQSGRGRTINGDRALLKLVDGRWYAYGYPCCGSSSICLNETMPIKAIVLLQKGEVNQVISTPLASRLRAMYLGIQVYPWERRETERAYALASQIAAQVPILTLSATPDLLAVSTLDGYLTRL